MLATFVGVGAAGAGVGSASTAVLRFLTAATVVVSPYIVVTDSATDGTSIAIRTPGAYTAVVMVPHVASTSLLLGISIGFAAVLPITANPVMGTAGVIATHGINTNPAATLAGRLLSIPFNVPDEEANTTRSVLRFLATDGSNATPVASFTAAGVWARVIRKGDLAA